MGSSEEPKLPVTKLAEAAEEILALKLRLASIEEQRTRGAAEQKFVKSNFSLKKIIWILFVEILRLLARKAVTIIYSKKRS